MPTSFFDLPREIREVIYDLVLVSSTGYVAPIQDKSSRTLRFCLHSANCNLRRVNTKIGNKKLLLKEDVISLSLLRTCRQMWDETCDLFWSKNTFLFPSAVSMKLTLKSMGQRLSRRIESVSFGFDLGSDCWRALRDLPNAFAILASRARCGSFRKLQLDLSATDFADLLVWKHCTNATFNKKYDDLLGILREASRESNFERSIRVYHGAFAKRLQVDVIRDVHLAFESTMVRDRDLELDENTSQGI